MASHSSSEMEESSDQQQSMQKPSKTMTLFKTVAACAFLYSAVNTYNNHNNNNNNVSDERDNSFPRRRLSMVGDDVPYYMEPMMKDLRERKKLFDETPPEEVKYWFEYTGPLQVSPPTPLL